MIKHFAIPILAWIIFFLNQSFHSPVLLVLAVLALLAAVMDAVHHAEIISQRVGEPYGALVLALSVTIIEVSIIISLMFEGGQYQAGLARDTVFSAVMIILNGLVGLSVLVGGWKHRDQVFSLQGVRSALTVLVAISVLTFILPNFTQSIPGPFYNGQQLLFVAIITLVLYGAFLFVQNIKHRDDFVSGNANQEIHERPDKRTAIRSLVLLPVNLLVVVLLAESLAPELEKFIDEVGAPRELAGVIIATVILLPEGIAAVKAARNNQLQQSLNLSIGSALATTGLTIPAVAFVSLFTGLPLSLGISPELMVLFILSLFVLVMSLSTGRTTILQGVVLVVIFLTYLQLMLVP
ncbi:ionic transporter y4hA [Flavihumibacter rivuli]|uniref:calcium:proton antiporter n=1 Tax=Flavihumibacter rivuli TaxID=2838156 RepID=UPI001BDF53CA|nr:ionic transporter y4hA [Flavihumibacter rivuli]ULQ57869.1 ionic transporter y4hA [Flavihumibacter rivuli]